MGSSSSSVADPEYQEGKNTDMNKKKPKPGDLIEIFRSGYEHWAVYIGSDYVVHFVLNGGNSSGSSVAAPEKLGVVKIEKLKKVVGNDCWKINNYLDEKYTPLESNKIVENAFRFIDAKLKYNLATYNCEHFATELRYGKPESHQVINKAHLGAGLAGALMTIGVASSAIAVL